MIPLSAGINIAVTNYTLSYALLIIRHQGELIGYNARWKEVSGDCISHKEAFCGACIPGNYSQLLEYCSRSEILQDFIAWLQGSLMPCLIRLTFNVPKSVQTIE